MNKTELTIKNLKLLVAAWEKQNFHPQMEEYGGIEFYWKDILKIGEVNECGTSCCSLGYAPSVRGLEIQDSDFDDNHRFSYPQYSERIFPEITGDCDMEWRYLFGDNWPNDRSAFIVRAKKLIENDLKLTPEMTQELKKSLR